MRILPILVITGLTAGSAAEGGFFDRLKDRATQAVEQEVNKEINKQVDSVQKDKEPPSEQQPQNDSAQSEKTNQTQPTTITSERDLYGRWEGRVVPAQHSLMETVGLTIVITPDFASMRCQAAGTRCLAELKPTGTLGTYDATILNQQAAWGTKATVSFADGGQVTVNWIDSPNTPAEKRINQGQLNKTIEPQTNHWSTTAEKRSEFDVVGFTPGMTYEEARAFLEAEHPDLEPSLNLVKDEGTTSIIYELKEKGARQMGSDVFGEQVTLGFESQTHEQMQVEQDPEVLAQIKEREAILQQRAEMQQAARANQRRRSRGVLETAKASQEALPEVPPMPKLRPEGADAELMFVSRQVQFLNNQMPYRDNVIQALTGKYGPPSIRVEPRTDRILLAWIFDASGDRIADAAGGPCDHLTQEPSPMKEKDKYYAVALRAGQAGGVFNRVTMSPDCGLTVKAQLDLDRNGAVRRVSTTAYDAQRLLADEWHRITEFNQALITVEKTKTQEMESRDVPDF